VIFVRGIMGNIKLNPAIKIWGGLLLISVAVGWTLFARISDYRDDIAACEAKGGVWIHGIPVRIGFARALGARCEAPKDLDNW